MASQSSAAAAIPDDKLEPGGVSVSKRFSVTWKIKQFSEKLTKKNREWVVANNSKTEGVLSPAFDLVFYPSKESPLTVIVEIFDGLRVEIIKLWIVNQNGVKRVAGKLTRGLFLNILRGGTGSVSVCMYMSYIGLKHIMRPISA